jgi:LPXTG-motif cell wall-anchored protein
VPPGHTGGGTGGGSSASLPYTGVSLGVPLAGGAALLTAGTAGLWLTRRRRHRV